MPNQGRFEIIIIGGGPAGYTAAIRAAQLKARVILVEQDRMGGTCLNYACVPTKFLRYAGEILHGIDKASRYGITVGRRDLDWAALQSRRQTLIDTQAEGMRGLLDDYGVRVIYGQARLLADRKVSVSAGAQENVYQAAKIIIATGSVPVYPDFPGAEHISSSRGLLEVAELPSRLAIVGGGPVGVELATIFAGFGVSVNLIEILPRILPGEDAELTELLSKEMKRASIRIFTASHIAGVEKSGNGYRVTLGGGSKETLEVDLVAMCTGQRPRLDGLGAAGLRTQNGALKVDQYLSTSTEGIYAAGDVTGKAMLAYVAMMQGRVAAENALGQKTAAKYDAIPRTVFSVPEFASVGLTEEEARANGRSVNTGRFPFSANVAAAIQGERRGLVKMVTETVSGRLLGVHILGPKASELIHEAAIALKKRASVADLQHTFHIHPALSEAVWEAAFDVTGASLSTRKSA